MNFEPQKHSKNILEVKGLCKYFPIYSKSLFQRQTRLVKAVDEVNFNLPAGKTLGLVGESGSGKTTTVRALLRALQPTSGEVIFQSRTGPVNLTQLSDRQLKPLRQEMQMIFQDPFSSLNPRMTVGEIVGEPLRIHRLANSTERKERVAQMLEKVGLKPEHISRYPHAFSGGQRQRIGIARALIMQPSLVVADEAVSALDVSVQAQVINLLAELQEEFHLSYIFVAHDLSVVAHICDRVAVMYAGRLVELADNDRIFSASRHPYTRLLMSTIPSPDPDARMNFAVKGEVADPADLPPGCPFNPRCPQSSGICREQRPELREIGTDGWVACHEARIN
jgi:oligopeptide/dipeptide ABC transporter ATP-binding protein